MLKFAFVIKFIFEFSIFKLLPSFLILNASVGSNTSEPQLILSSPNEVSLDSATSAYAIVEDGLLLNQKLLLDNKATKKVKNTLSFLKAHQEFVSITTIEFNKNLISMEKELVTGVTFNWSSWYKELKDSGGIVVDQKTNPLASVAQANFTPILKKTLGKKNFTLSSLTGKFFLKDGLFLNTAKIFIYQSLNGLKISEAKVNYQKAQFSFKSLVEGAKVVAELRSQAGELVGFSQILVSSIRKSKVLNIYDIGSGIKAEVLSSLRLWGSGVKSLQDNINTSMYIESVDQKVLKLKDLYQANNLGSQSNYLLGAYSSQHWPSLSFANTFSLNTLYSFSKSMINSVLYLLEWDFGLSDKPSIIWGRVSYKGKPVAGAKLELYNSDITPVYFDSWIPDSALTSTGASGLFAFIGVKSGLSSIRIKASKYSYNLKFVPVQSGKISFIEFIESKVKPKQVLTYDLFSRKSIQSKLKLLGANKPVVIPLNNIVNLSQQNEGENLQLFEVNPGSSDYQTISAISFSNKNQLEVPMLRKSWLNKVAKNIIQDREKSILVGFGERGVNFSVNLKALVESEPYLESNIVYFDSQSQVYTSPSNKAIGFIAFNLPKGLYSANLIIRGSTLLQATSKLVISEPESVQILKF